MIRCTTFLPVSGSEHSCTILCEPSLATCSISTMTRLAPCTRSIAPPIPLTIFPGIIQLAMSPPAETCMAPRMAASTLPPRIIPNEVAESKKEAPRTHGDGLLAGVDQVGVDGVVGGVGAETEDAVLGLQHDLDVVGHVVGHEGRQADAEVDVGAVLELGGGAGGHLLTGPAHAATSRLGDGAVADGALLDALVGGLLPGEGEHPVDEDAGRVDLVGVELAGLDELLDLGDRDAPGHGGERVEVAAGLVEDQVAVPVALPGPHEGEVADDGLLEHVVDGHRSGAPPWRARRPRPRRRRSYFHGRPPSATWVPTPVAV